jgi:hypothetical protein
MGLLFPPSEPGRGFGVGPQAAHMIGNGARLQPLSGGISPNVYIAPSGFICESAFGKG